MNNCTTTTEDKYIYSQLELLHLDLLEFYEKPENLNKFRQVISGNIPNISLRLIDWFSTNYAKKYYTTYFLESTQKRFKVFDSYKLKLRAYGKDNFDAFSRGKRIDIPYTVAATTMATTTMAETTIPMNDGEDKKEKETTTIGQMNFFKWAIENKIVEYILENLEAIKRDMDSRSSNSKKKKDTIVDETSKTRKKREELSVCATKCIIKEKVSITIKFST
jgi:hypothetical protein